MTCGLLWPCDSPDHRGRVFCRTLLTSLRNKKAHLPHYTVKSTLPLPVGYGHHHQDSQDLTVPHLPFFLHLSLLYGDNIIMWLYTLKSRNGYSFILIIFLFPISPSPCSPQVWQPLFPLTYLFREGETDRQAHRALLSHLLQPYTNN